MAGAIVRSMKKRFARVFFWTLFAVGAVVAVMYWLAYCSGPELPFPIAP